MQCTAFLILSFPYLDLIDLGRKDLAISGSYGPQSYLSAATALFCLTYIAIHDPFVNYYTIWLNYGSTVL